MTGVDTRAGQRTISCCSRNLGLVAKSHVHYQYRCFASFLRVCGACFLIVGVNQESKYTVRRDEVIRSLSPSSWPIFLTNFLVFYRYLDVLIISYLIPI